MSHATRRITFPPWGASPLVLIRAATAAEVCRSYTPRPPAQALLEEGLTPLHFMDRLVARVDLYPDAVDFLARALLPRGAVFWGCLCLWRISGPKLSAAEKEAIAAVVRWVVTQDEAERQAAEGSAAVAKGSLAGQLATAAARSGGSMVLANLPPVPPPPTLTADLASGVLHRTALLEGSAGSTALYRQIVALGIGVALRKYPLALLHPEAAPEEPFWPGQEW